MAFEGGRLSASSGGLARRRLVCHGTVQGVGFRPTVHNVACALGLTGWVLNGPEGARLEVQGPGETVGRFAAELRRALPPLARLEALEESPVPLVRGERGFRVLPSSPGPRTRALVPPDAALCPDCRTDLETAGNRRRRYPFTTCTACGPRFSMVRAWPYDRERTSMACFPLCPRCRAEYEDPSDRRFHAEPVCCPTCGPSLWLAKPGGEALARGEAALEGAREALARGRIVAVKGLGGFQLACRADSEAAVSELRRRKGRGRKPFAVMVPDLSAARLLARLAPQEEALMASYPAPILLAPRRLPSPLAKEVAPGLAEVGLLLPTTPLHVELFRTGAYTSLVMTSGNLSEEPICCGNREALARLCGLADLFLLHDRDVVRRVDDSVARTGPFGPMVLRRSRGWVPEPVPLSFASPEPVLALGGHLRATACLAVRDEAFLSQHVGDQETDAARAFLREAAAGLEDFLQVSARAIAVDLHPDYPSAWYGEELARARGGRLFRLQHHLAHAAAVLAEHARFPEAGGRAAALVLDGTGWGTDGTAWGCEWLLLDGGAAWSRAAHMEAVPLVGGEAAVREPWRLLVAALASCGEEALLADLPVASLVGTRRLFDVARLAGGAWPMASGAGRLFEAAGALLGLAETNTWEGEAAVRLEGAAAAAPPCGPWPEARLIEGPKGPLLPFSALLVLAARRLASGSSPESVALGLHKTFALLAVEQGLRVIPVDARTVALGGGCLANRILAGELAVLLSRAGLEPLLPRAVPPGDGGLALGQAALAAAALRAGEEWAERLP